MTNPEYSTIYRPKGIEDVTRPSQTNFFRILLNLKCRSAISSYEPIITRHGPLSTQNDWEQMFIVKQNRCGFTYIFQNGNYQLFQLLCVTYKTNNCEAMTSPLANSYIAKTPCKILPGRCCMGIDTKWCWFYPMILVNGAYC